MNGQGLLLNYSQSNHKRTKILFVFLFFLLILFFILDLFLGSVIISPHEVFRALFRDAGNVTETILMRFRIPKAVTALLAGVALSVSGLQMQTLFRNPMAGPYVLGLSSGASFGVAVVILGFSSIASPENAGGLGNWAIAAASWLGAGSVMLLIMMISARVKNIMTVLILGIMLSSAISAVVSIMQYFSSATMLKSYVIWTMGSLGNVTSGQLKVMTASVAAGTILSLISVKMLNALLLGEDYALSIGLEVKTSRNIIIAGTSILAGTVTAFCGPIGFVGIAVPHLARLIFRTADHRVLIPASILTGSLIMLGSDIASQLPGSDKVLPVNAVTALIGIPVVIWVILRNQRSGEIF
ncbi:MAG TPA: iron ABC transporter permease [Bacteroidales bacterium]|jgi:iron complex transport system permease protein|nr:iron ABC transporter permease [Bacteroidales bacterium]